jgi:hypothetical protein
MTRALGILFILSSSGVAQSALMTNFAGSYAKYQSCSLLMPASKCYKLYCDPTGIEEGVITAYVDVPDLVGRESLASTWEATTSS